MIEQLVLVLGRPAAVLDNARVIFRIIFATSSKLACIGDPPQGNSLVYNMCRYKREQRLRQ